MLRKNILRRFKGTFTNRFIAHQRCFSSQEQEEDSQKHLSDYIDEITNTNNFKKKIQDIRNNANLSKKEKLEFSDFQIFYSALTEISRPLFYTMNQMHKNKRRKSRLSDFEKYGNFCKDQTDTKINTFFSAKDKILEELDISYETFDDSYDSLTPEMRLMLNNFWTMSTEEAPDYDKLEKFELEQTISVVEFTKNELENFQKKFIEEPFKIHLENIKKYDDPNIENENIEDQSMKLLDLSFIVDYWVVDARFDEYNLEYLEYNELVLQTLNAIEDKENSDLWKVVREAAFLHQNLKEKIMTALAPPA